jgi:hypothetical protein
MRDMDTAGARFLAARLEAGVRAGSIIQLLSDTADASPAQTGDIGTVQDIKEDGNILVQWDDGFTSDIHPTRSSYRVIAA